VNIPAKVLLWALKISAGAALAYAIHALAPLHFPSLNVQESHNV